MGCLRAAIVLWAGLLALTAGCSQTRTGSPVAAPGSVPAPGTSSPAGPTAQATATRPRTIDLKSVDACQVLSRLPAEFGIQGRNLYPDKSLGFPGNTECGVSNPDKGFTLGLTPVTTYDAEQFAGVGRGRIERTTIAGFPAFTQNLGDGNPACFAGVSVADGQMLYLQWLYNRTAGSPSTAVKCAEATKAMTAVMAVLEAS